MNVNIWILIAVLFAIGIILNVVIVKTVGKNLPQESEQTQEDQPQGESYKNIENEDLANKNAISSGRELDALKTVAYNALSLEESSNQGIT